MQDEINSKVIALSVRLGTASAKMTAHALRQAIQKYLAEKQRPKAKAVDHAKHGKQTVGQLMKKNTELTNIEITDQNIKSFERVAKKYNKAKRVSRSSRLRLCERSMSKKKSTRKPGKSCWERMGSPSRKK